MSRIRNPDGVSLRKPAAIELDLQAAAPLITGITYTQYDNCVNTLIVKLTNDGKSFKIPAETRVEFNFQTPSGKKTPKIGRVVSASGGKTACGIDRAILTEAGVFLGSVTLIGEKRQFYGKSRLTWPKFVFGVEESLAETEPPDDSPYYDRLYDMLLDLKTQIGELSKKLDDLEFNCNCDGANPVYTGAAVGRALTGSAVVGKVA
jgi:hypothetical protein